jgi:AcrR family transcriptional regulator
MRLAICRGQDVVPVGSMTHRAASQRTCRTEPFMRFLSGIEPTWKEPSQERSRERVAAILSAARELIAEGGLGNLKMGLLAERAGVPIGTIYQFFPDKDAVIGCIFAAQMEESLQDVYLACNPGYELEAPAEAVTSIMMAKYHEWRADPVMAEIWSIAQAHRTLRSLTRAASEATAEIKAQALQRFLRPGVSEVRLRRVLFMISDLYDAAIHAALDFPEDEAAELMDEYAIMVSSHIGSLLQPSARRRSGT